MDVVEILSIAAHTCGMGDEPDKKELEKIFLPYLNLVNFDVFNHVSGVNSGVSVSVKKIDIVNGQSQPLDKQPYQIKGVFSDSNRPLKRQSNDWILQHNPLRQDKQNNGLPCCYWLENKKLNIYPAYDCCVTMVQIDQPKRLEMTTKSDEIPYPESYHAVLVDGLCYHLYVDELGETNKSTHIAYAKYTRGKNDLKSYFLNGLHACADYSTYRGL